MLTECALDLCYLLKKTFASRVTSNMKLLLIFTALICALLLMASAQKMKPSQDKDDEEPVEKLLKVGDLIAALPCSVCYDPCSLCLQLTPFWLGTNMNLYVSISLCS